MPVHLAESPLTCVAVGSGRSLEEFEAIHRSAARAAAATAAAATKRVRHERPPARFATLRPLRASQPHRKIGGAGPSRPASRPATAFLPQHAAPSGAAIVLGLLVLLSLALITVSFRESSDGPLHDAQGAVASVLQPFEVAAERVARPFRDAYGWTKDLFDARSENEKLRAENEQLRQQVIQNESALQRERRAQAAARLPATRPRSRRTTTASPPR